MKLVVLRKTDKTCARQLVIADADLKLDLPLNKKVVATFTPAKSGELKYGCAMGMLGGVLKIE